MLIDWIAIDEPGTEVIHLQLSFRSALGTDVVTPILVTPDYHLRLYAVLIRRYSNIIANIRPVVHNQ